MIETAALFAMHAYGVLSACRAFSRLCWLSRATATPVPMTRLLRRADAQDDDFAREGALAGATGACVR